LAIAISGPPLLGAVGTPVLAAIIRGHGWRAGCVAIAVVTAVLGTVALALLPRAHGDGDARAKPKARTDYRAIARSPVFWILLAGVLLCNLYHSVTTSQLGVVLDDSVHSGSVATLVSIFAVAVIAGRFACGLALDRCAPHVVAAIALALPGFGCLLVASTWDSYAVVVAAVCCLGAAWGAEGDVIAYLVSRRFDLSVYSSVLSILSAAIGVSSAVGAVILSRTLRETQSFNGFLVFAGGSALVGGALLLVLRRYGPNQVVSASASVAEGF
jgi:predicted MFS family arabinose efflux permease